MDETTKYLIIGLNIGVSICLIIKLFSFFLRDYYRAENQQVRDKRKREFAEQLEKEQLIKVQQELKIIKETVRKLKNKLGRGKKL